MPGIAVRSLDSAGGAQLAGQQNFVTAEGELVVLRGDPVTPHAPLIPPHTAPVMAEGCDWLTINGIPVCREGHLANCGHASTGRGWLQIIG
jgi:uncharacterized Zn-binding protein involved in type VI secretion